MHDLYLHYANALCWINPPRFFARLQTLDWYIGVQREWMATLQTTPGQSILEVGCGPGLLAAHLAQLGIKIIGADRSPRMLRRASAHAHALGVQAAFTLANAENLHFRDNLFDRTIAASVINIVQDPCAVLAEMARVTRPGGLVSVLFPSEAMNPGQASHYGVRRHLPGFSGAALRLWARRAPKLGEKDIARVAAKIENLTLIGTHRFLDDMVIAMTYQKQPPPL